MQSVVCLDCSSPAVWGHGQAAVRYRQRLRGEQQLLHHRAARRAQPAQSLCRSCAALSLQGETSSRAPPRLCGATWWVKRRRANLSSERRLAEGRRQGAQLKFSFIWKSRDGELRASATGVPSKGSSMHPCCSGFPSWADT